MVEIFCFYELSRFFCFCEKHKKVIMKDFYFSLVYKFKIGERIVRNQI